MQPFDLYIPAKFISSNKCITTGSRKMLQVIIIVILAGLLTVVTIIGNILVILSIIFNRHLKTITNYFILSLAFSDLIVAVVCMNLYTIYNAFGYWPMGPVVCDLWLALDHVVNNASSMNLVVISFDRYFCVTKPLSYPTKRTPQMALMMITAAWVLPFILWAPSILLWQFIVGEQTVHEGQCYIPFLSNPAVTLGILIMAFYLPAFIMAVLYVCISLASKSRIKDDKECSESSKDTLPLSPIQQKPKKLMNNILSNVSNWLLHIKSKIPNEITMDTFVQGEFKVVSNERTSLSSMVSNQMNEETIQENTNIFTIQSHLWADNAKLSCVTIVSQSNTANDGASRVETVSGFTINNRNERNIGEGHCTMNPSKTPAKIKKLGASREKKVTRTIMAIVLAFLITWTPYVSILLIDTFCSVSVPNIVWNLGYWLCYTNSAINPACYALCNNTFKKTFKYLLLCQYKNFVTAR
ncbi:muscarinic acetylcholine receptor M2-like [Rhincodon typus]|uniref:muscarinic acetylcholine receptor M2-like n=1 Tax=Rhincodon typus TaxID=259920 RepID=UPI00202DD6E2|nr:muscarinic acetylcholine receptor M2-like [Rhincodon typus]